MKMVRLGSVVEYGFGPNTGAISLIYSHLLEKYDVEIKDHILINHIGADLQEQIIKIQKGKVGINIRYQLPPNFSTLDGEKKNAFFTEIIHEALLRLSKNRAEIEVDKLEAIRKEILDKSFAFFIPYKRFPFKKDNRLLSVIYIVPEISKFCFFAVISNGDKEICRLLVYSGVTSTNYFDDLFFYGRWKTANHFVLSGKRSEIEIHLHTEGCQLQFSNKNEDISKAPVFELFRSDSDKEKALQDYIYSLNPAISAIITQSLN